MLCGSHIIIIICLFDFKIYFQEQAEVMHLKGMEAKKAMSHGEHMESLLPSPILNVCNPILVTTFPEWLSGTETWPRTPGAVRPSSSCL